MRKILFFFLVLLLSIFSLSAQTHEQIAKENLRLRTVMMQNIEDSKKKIKILQDSIKKITGGDIQNIESRIRAEKKQITYLLPVIDSLAEAYKTLANKYKTLETDRKGKIDHLKKAKEQLEKELTLLKVTINTKDTEIENLKRELENKQKYLDSLKNITDTKIKKNN